jgi:hypothetical protein
VLFADPAVERAMKVQEVILRPSPGPMATYAEKVCGMWERTRSPLSPKNSSARKSARTSYGWIGAI